MGFYFRKSISFGGLRINFSKSGIGDILLHDYHNTANNSQSIFIVDLSDLNITTGTYEIRVYYEPPISSWLRDQ